MFLRVYLFAIRMRLLFEGVKSLQLNITATDASITGTMYKMNGDAIPIKCMGFMDESPAFRSKTKAMSKVELVIEEIDRLTIAKDELIKIADYETAAEFRKRIEELKNRKTL